MTRTLTNTFALALAMLVTAVLVTPAVTVPQSEITMMAELA